MPSSSDHHDTYVGNPYTTRQHRHFQQAPQRNIDHDSGQVYHETEIVFRSKNAINWMRDFRTPGIIKKATSIERHPRSLLDMARSKCVNELRDLAPEHFEVVPWTVAADLWNEVVSRHMESFYGWKLLASVYGNEAEFGNPEKRYFLALRQTPLPLTDYYGGLTSESDKWHVALRISPKQQATSDLVAIARITNLVALDLSDGQLLLDTRPSVFDHRIMRTWAELAQSRKAFKNLRVLMLGWQDNVSEWMFHYLEHFPSLCYLIVTDCKDLHQKNRSDWEELADRKGWTALHAKKSAKTLRTRLEDGDFQLCNISNLYYEDAAVQTTPEMASRPRKRVRPVVECWIGSPRPWTHIIDEFPGTRTIWFERNAIGSQSVSFSAPKRLREQARPAGVTSSPPPKRPQRTMKDRPRGKPASDAASLLAELDFVNVCR